MTKEKFKADSMKTKTGKTRLGPLNIDQLYKFLNETTKPKEKGKIQNRIRTLEKRGHKVKAIEPQE